MDRDIDTTPKGTRPARSPGAHSVDDRPPEPLDPAHREAILQGLDDIRRGDIATEAEVEAVFARFRS